MSSVGLASEQFILRRHGFGQGPATPAGLRESASDRFSDCLLVRRCIIVTEEAADSADRRVVPESSMFSTAKEIQTMATIVLALLAAALAVAGIAFLRRSPYTVPQTLLLTLSRLFTRILWRAEVRG